MNVGMCRYLHHTLIQSELQKTINIDFSIPLFRTTVSDPLENSDLARSHRDEMTTIRIRPQRFSESHPNAMRWEEERARVDVQGEYKQSFDGVYMEEDDSGKYRVFPVNRDTNFKVSKDVEDKNDYPLEEELLIPSNMPYPAPVVKELDYENIPAV